MKKKIIALLLVCMCTLVTVTPAFASNIDSTFPSTFISNTSSYESNHRYKENSSSVYINNTSGLDLNVNIYGATNISSYGANCTPRKTIVQTGKWLMHNTVNESGYTYCYLKINANKSGVSGYLTGQWSPDSVGSYPYAN